jgi:MFS family permease
VTRLRGVTDRTFRSLQTRNFRYYFSGQIVSAFGSWMQLVAQAWLVLELTHDGLALGITTALQFLPMLVAGAWGGAVADRLDKRRLLVATSVALGALAAVLGALTSAGVTEIWMVWVLAFALGCVTAIDNPARRSFVSELVPPDQVANAVSLNSTMFTTARAIGPMIAGVIIATAGVPWCFLLNAVSFVGVIVAMRAIRPDELYRVPPIPRAKRQVREGIAYAWRTPDLRLALGLVLVLGIFAFNYQTQLPLVARRVFDTGAEAFGAMFFALSIGSVGGSLFGAHHGRANRRLMVGAAFFLGVAYLVLSLAPSFAVALVLLVPVGFFANLFTTMSTAVCQEMTSPELRGRVMALWGVAFLGSTPIGGPIIGGVADAFGARATLVVAGLGAAVPAVVAILTRGLPARGADEAAVSVAGAAESADPGPLSPRTVT